jgi:hypothetical protein
VPGLFLLPAYGQENLTVVAWTKLGGISKKECLGNPRVRNAKVILVLS